MKKKKNTPYELEVDPRDPHKALWEWLVFGRMAIRAPHSDERVMQVSSDRVEDHRQKREAWLTDEEVLTRALTAE